MSRRAQNYTPFPSNDRAEFRPKMSKNGKKCRNFQQGFLGTFRGLQLVLLNSLTEPLVTGVQPLLGRAPEGASSRLVVVSLDRHGESTVELTWMHRMRWRFLIPFMEPSLDLAVGLA